MTNRITNRMMTDLGVRRMNDRLNDFERAQTDLTTGKRIRVASDDPAGMSRSLRIVPLSPPMPRQKRTRMTDANGPNSPTPVSEASVTQSSEYASW